LNLGLFVEQEHERVLGRVDLQADDFGELGRELGVVGALEGRMRCGCRSCADQILCTERRLIPVALAIARLVQWGASAGRSAQVSATTCWAMAAPSGRLAGLRLASRSKPSMPDSARRCQRQTAGRPA
jgi:hypothetical protein